MENRPDPNHQVVWFPPRPHFVIKLVSSTSTNRGYHESFYEVVSLNALSDEDMAALDKINLIGFGQAYSVEQHEIIKDVARPVTIDRRTGLTLPDVPPRGWGGQPITRTQEYQYHRYVARRICDSGD